MNTAEKQEYDNFIKSVRISRSAIESARFEGREEGLELTKVRAVLKGHENNLPISLISNIIDISEEEVIKILKDHGKIK